MNEFLLRVETNFCFTSVDNNNLKSHVCFFSRKKEGNRFMNFKMIEKKLEIECNSTTIK